MEFRKSRISLDSNCDFLTASIACGPCLEECTDAKVLKRYLKLLDDDGMNPQMSCEAFLFGGGVECFFVF